MDIDDLEPRKQPTAAKNLEVLSIEALHAYIAELEGEIARVREMIAKKTSARAGAEGFFRR
jgi:uncharacterized small protein (DUF1192 family)